MNNQQIIPVMTTFDNNYSAPAAVCFYSLLKNSNKDYQYNLYVLNTDITEENKVKLRKTIANFPNAKLEFINMQGKFEDLFKNTKSKGHYTKEMYYKFLAPSIFPQYEKIIITDVDVVFMSDISQIYNDFSVEENLYLYGHRLPDRKDNWTEKFLEKTYEKEWTFEEYSKLNISAGFLVFNLKKMREDDLETKFVDFAMKNAYRIKQPEQDTINFICYPLIKYMPFRAVFCSYLYDVYKIAEDFSKSLVYSALEIKQTFENSPPDTISLCNQC